MVKASTQNIILNLAPVESEFTSKFTICCEQPGFDSQVVIKVYSFLLSFLEKHLCKSLWRLYMIFSTSTMKCKGAAIRLKPINAKFTDPTLHHFKAVYTQNIHTAPHRMLTTSE